MNSNFSKKNIKFANRWISKEPVKSGQESDWNAVVWAAENLVPEQFVKGTTALHWLQVASEIDASKVNFLGRSKRLLFC